MAGEISAEEVSEVQKLVLCLYEPNPPEVISSIQATLSQLQSSPNAWALAEALLNQVDEKVKFFGALTIIIKLNNESATLDDNQAHELLLKLIQWYMGTAQQDGSQIASRKLISALSTFYLHFSRLWPGFIYHLAASLVSKAAYLPVSTQESDFYAILEQLSDKDALCVTEVANHVMEDILRLDLGSSSTSDVYQNLLENAHHIAQLIVMSIMDPKRSHETVNASMKCLQVFVAVLYRGSSGELKWLATVKPVLSTVIERLINPTTFDIAAELLSDILENYPSLLSAEQCRLLQTTLTKGWATPLYNKLLDGDFDFDSVQLVSLLVTFAESKLDDLLASENTTTLDLLALLSNLLGADGVAAVEDKTFVPILEFWSTMAETLQDYIGPEKNQSPFVEAYVMLLLDACSKSWRKTSYPQPEDYGSWDAGDRMTFNEARKDVVDFLQSVYAIVGPELVSTFVNVTGTVLHEENWYDLEAAAYCLGGLADCCKDDARCDGFLALVFQSDLFAKLQANRETMPAKTRQSCVALIEQYTEYFERNPALLLNAVELLFSFLGEKNITTTAAKAIFRLASSCRHRLYQRASLFLGEYNRINTQHHLACLPAEKVFGGLACLCQANPNMAEKYDLCNEMIQVLRQELHNSSTAAAEGGAELCCQDAVDDDPKLHQALRILRCISSISKGFQVPADGTVDVDGKPAAYSLVDSGLSRLQEKIVATLMDIQSVFSQSNEVTELICGILRSGFSETEPGPFVLPHADVAHYLTRHTISTPRIALLVNTSCSFVSSLRNSPAEKGLSNTILSWITGLLQQMDDVNSDTELTQNSIEFLTRLFRQDASVLLNLEPRQDAEFLYLTALLVLDGREPLPKAASAEFWTHFVNFRSISEGVELSFKTTMDTLGPLLCKTLVRNIGGNASRSELDRITEPLKKVIFRHSKAQEWLLRGIHDDTFPSDKVSVEDKVLFVKKIISLRGSRTTNQVVRDFWLSCRGSHFAYAS